MQNFKIQFNQIRPNYTQIYMTENLSVAQLSPSLYWFFSILQINKNDEANVKMNVCYKMLHKDQIYCLSWADTEAGIILGNILN